MTKHKKQKGIVDRVEGDVVVIVTSDPDSDNKDDSVELYVHKDKFKQTPKEGDAVTVDIE